MPTDETPSAEAVTRAYTTQETCQAARHTITGMCAHCAALALETFARELCDKGDQAWEKIYHEREATVWEEAANWMEEEIFDLTATVDDAVGVIRRIREQAAKKFRARAAEERTKP